MPGTSTGGLSTTPTRKRWWRTRPTFTAVTAVVAFLISVYTFYRAEIEVDVRVIFAEQTSLTEPRTIDVGLVNYSERTVSITRATVWFGDAVVGRVNRFVPGLGDLDPRPTAERLAQAGRPPLSLASGEAFTGTVTWTDFVTGDRAPGLTAAVDRYLSASRTAGQDPDGKLRIEFDLAPGGSEAHPVALTIGDETLERLAGGPTGDWPATLLLEPGSGQVSGIAVYGRRLALGTVEVWSDEPEPVAKITRPLLADRRTVFPFADLTPGSYLWTLTAGEDGPVTGGAFATPCEGPEAVREVEPSRCEPAGG